MTLDNYITTPPPKVPPEPRVCRRPAEPPEDLMPMQDANGTPRRRRIAPGDPLQGVAVELGRNARMGSAHQGRAGPATAPAPRRGKRK